MCVAYFNHVFYMKSIVGLVLILIVKNRRQALLLIVHVIVNSQKL